MCGHDATALDEEDETLLWVCGRDTARPWSRQETHHQAGRARRPWQWRNSGTQHSSL